MSNACKTYLLVIDRQRRTDKCTTKSRWRNDKNYGRAESQADAEATTVASSHEEASTPSTKKRPTMSGRAVATPQLPSARVPTDVLWRSCSFDERLAVETVVQRVKWCVDTRLAEFKPAGFKIGIASDPVIRFHHRAGGYRSEGYDFMDVVWRSTPANCVDVETSCVDAYIGELGCQNETRGGGGVNAKRCDYWQHVYVAFAPISSLAEFRSERASRTRRAPLRVGGFEP